jgi:outer membrane protein assembly factor BamB
VGDLLAVSSCNGMIRALDRKTGLVRWEYDIRKDGEQSQFHGDPLVTDRLLVIGTDGRIGYVYAFERMTGAVIWKYKVNDRGVASDIIRFGGEACFVTLGNELVCVELETGKPKWSFRSSYSGSDDCLTCSSPAVSEGRIFFGGLDGFAYALNADNGKVEWKRDLGAKVTTSAAVNGNSVYLGTDKGHVYRLSVESGEVLGDAATNATPYGHLIPAGDSLFAFLGDELVANFNLDLKKLRWTAEAPKEWTSARPYLWRDFVLAGNRHELIALRSADGSRAWSFQFPQTVRGIGMSADVLYVGTLKGPIFAYSPNLQ